MWTDAEGAAGEVGQEGEGEDGAQQREGSRERGGD